jgi:hypothetical protein
LHGVGESNTAYNTMGGPRVLSYGWDPDLYDVPGQPQHNQAHHLAAFIIAGMSDVNILGHDLAKDEALGLDGTVFSYNEHDYNLSLKAIELGKSMAKDNYNDQNIKYDIYKVIHPNL